MLRIRPTTPYDWPYDGAVAEADAVLLICGAGTEWAARTPSNPVVEQRLSSLRTALADVGVRSVHLHHDPPTHRPPAGLPEDPSPALDLRTGDLVVAAAGIDGFYGSALDPVLRRLGVSHLFVVGRGLETTVHSTLRRANDRGYECLTVADACSPLDPDLVASSVSSIEMSGGIFGAVTSTEAVLSSIGNSR